MKKLLLAILLCIGLQSVTWAQSFSVPRYSFKAEKDYILYEQIVLNAYDWLLTTPVMEQPEKRQEVYQFIASWFMGTPTIMVTPNQVLAEMVIDPHWEIMCLGGYTASLLNDKKEAGVLNTQEATTRGVSVQEQLDATYDAIRYAIDFYAINKEALGRNEAIEKYIKLEKKDQLKKYIEKNAELQ